ncbi:inositol monophosphatase 3 [Schistosoma japonicum]|nr:inositol monophosphatase 3 [Schistosoma japonicum]
MIIRLSTHGWCVLMISILVIFLYYLSSFNPIGHLKGEVISVRGLLIRCIHLSEEAGGLIKSTSFKHNLNLRTKFGGILSQEPLTDADLGSHQIIVSGIKSTFPGLLILSEEHDLPKHVVDYEDVFHSDFQSSLPNDDLFVPVTDLAVWVDPLDGTQEYTVYFYVQPTDIICNFVSHSLFCFTSGCWWVEGLNEYVSVMICIVLHDHPIAGIIHQPFLNKTYWGWSSFGLSSDLKIAVTSRATQPSKTDLSITYSRSHLNESLIKDLTRIVYPKQVNFLPAGGTGFKAISLIKGEADVYIHPSATRRWDVCAAQAVLEAVGGRLTGFDGSTLGYGRSSSPYIPRKVGIFGAADPADKMYVYFHKHITMV